MAEKISAMVICAVVIAVVVYAVVFLTPESTNLQVVPNTTQKEYYIQVAEQEKLRMQEEGRDFEAENRARIAEYRREHNLRKKIISNPMEQWMQECLRTGVLESLDRANHEVAIDPVTWRLASIDAKWTFMKCVHVYFDGYATIVSSTSGRPLASYNAWSGIKIHD